MTLSQPQSQAAPAGDLSILPIFELEGSGRIPRHEMPADGMPADVAYQIVHDELMLDGNARMNVATFVTTWMEPQAEKLMAECFDKNMIDKDEYPQTAEIERREHGRSSVTAAMTDALSDGLRTDRVAERTTG